VLTGKELQRSPLNVRNRLASRTRSRQSRHLNEEFGCSPVSVTGVYDPDRIAFLGLHRPSVDVRGAYTYLDPQTGLEISAALGTTQRTNPRGRLRQRGAPDLDGRPASVWHG
jgi:hypothetical protein